VLLVVLWERSYWWRDAILYQYSDPRVIVFGSMHGRLLTYEMELPTSMPRWQLRTGETTAEKNYWADTALQQYRGILGIGVYDSPPVQMLCAPHWFFLLSIGAVAAASCSLGVSLSALC